MLSSGYQRSGVWGNGLFVHASARPQLTQLILLAAGNQTMAEQLLTTPVERCDHPHYGFMLDTRDQQTLASVRKRATSVEQFLLELADIAEGFRPE